MVRISTEIIKIVIDTIRIVIDVIWIVIDTICIVIDTILIICDTIRISISLNVLFSLLGIFWVCFFERKSYKVTVERKLKDFFANIK